MWKNQEKPALFMLAVVALCGAVVLVPGDISWGDDGFYVIGGGSPWRRNGANIYYTAGNVGIGQASPLSPLDVQGTDSSIYAAASNTATSFAISEG